MWDIYSAAAVTSSEVSQLDSMLVNAILKFESKPHLLNIRYSTLPLCAQLMLQNHPTPENVTTDLSPPLAPGSCIHYCLILIRNRTFGLRSRSTIGVTLVSTGRQGVP